MKTLQWHSAEGAPSVDDGRYQLALVFGHPEDLNEDVFAELAKRLPDACVVGCTAGIFFHGNQYFEAGYSVTALQWEGGTVHAESVPIDPDKRPSAAVVAENLLKRGQPTGAVFLWNEPSESADAYLQELQDSLGPDCPILGGLAADADFQFRDMSVYSNGSQVLGAVVGLYGENLQLKTSHATGLEWVGGTREITRAEGCTILEIDGEPAVETLNRLGIDMSKKPEARGLSSLQMVTESGEPGLVRTPLRIDDERGALICGAPVPEGEARFLSFTDHEAILNSAAEVVEDVFEDVEAENGFCLVVNCGARYRMLGPTWELELDYIAEKLLEGFMVAGFYAYGEVAPLRSTGRSELHSQTITVASLSHPSDKP